jgi:hypothetical protein
LGKVIYEAGQKANKEVKLPGSHEVHCLSTRGKRDGLVLVSWQDTRQRGREVHSEKRGS